MMGDNRDNSTDSRVPPDQGGVGYVPFENLEGRAEMIFFSVGEGAAGWEFWRWPLDPAPEPHVPAGKMTNTLDQTLRGELPKDDRRRRCRRASVMSSPIRPCWSGR